MSFPQLFRGNALFYLFILFLWKYFGVCNFIHYVLLYSIYCYSSCYIYYIYLLYFVTVLFYNIGITDGKKIWNIKIKYPFLQGWTMRGHRPDISTVWSLWRMVYLRFTQTAPKSPIQIHQHMRTTLEKQCKLRLN